MGDVRGAMRTAADLPDPARLVRAAAHTSCLWTREDAMIDLPPSAGAKPKTTSTNPNQQQSQNPTPEV
jgi:hypothetical protein